MKRLLGYSFFSLTCLSCFSQSEPERRLDRVFNASDSVVLVAAHRGDWRNAPENSVQGMRNCIAMGVDIMEFDVKETRDGVPIILHDDLLDRTTTGTGRPETYSLSEIKEFRLRAGTGHPTGHPVPTLAEMLDTAKGKIIVDIDKGYPYYDKVIGLLTERKMLGQAILNIYGLSYDSVLRAHPSIPEALTLQIIVNEQTPDLSAVIDSYRQHKKTIVQVIFKSDTGVLLRQAWMFRKTWGVWMNGLWPEQDGGHNDDRAVEEGMPDETWGWLIRHGANIIQTDRPRELKQWLAGRQ